MILHNILDILACSDESCIFKQVAPRAMKCQCALLEPYKREAKLLTCISIIRQYERNQDNQSIYNHLIKIYESIAENLHYSDDQADGFK